MGLQLLLLPVVEGRVRKKNNKIKNQKVHKTPSASLSASAQTFLPECRNPFMTPFLSRLVAFSRLYELHVVRPWDRESENLFLLLTLPLASTHRDGPDFSFLFPLHP